MNFHVFEMRTGMNVYDHRTVLALLSSSEKDLKNSGLAPFLKSPETFRVPQFPFYLLNAELLGHQTS